MTSTYLYIKQHSVTGKLYFGKTIRNPESYMGSGDYWKAHIAKHGKEHVETIWYCLFYDKEELINFALQCSKNWNIVESDDWANEKLENGLDGWTPGQTHSPETKQKIARAMTGKKMPAGFRVGSQHSLETKQKISFAQKGRQRTNEHNAKITKSRAHNTEWKQNLTAVRLAKSNRQNVKELRELTKKTKTILGKAWSMKSDEWIDAKIIELSRG